MAKSKSLFSKDKGDLFAPCQICRSITVYRSGSGWGSVRHTYDRKGKLIDTDTSRLNFRQSTVVRCTGCGVVRNDVKIPQNL